MPLKRKEGSSSGLLMHWWKNVLIRNKTCTKIRTKADMITKLTCPAAKAQEEKDRKNDINCRGEKPGFINHGRNKFLHLSYHRKHEYCDISNGQTA